MSAITIHKLNLAGEETLAYPGTVMHSAPGLVVVEAFFQRYARLELGYTVFERGDRMVEYFYSDRWFNVFDVYAVTTGARRGWYCNLARPATWQAGHLWQVDLALDVWVHPDGRWLALDEDEFAALPLDEPTRATCRAALAELTNWAATRHGPFADAV